LRELRTMGKTIVISSHILPELEELCTSVAIVDQGRVLASGTVDEIQARFRRGLVVRVRVLSDGAAAQRFLTSQPEVSAVDALPDGRLELALRGPDDVAAELLARTIAAGHRIAAFAPAVSDLEELFLQVTSETDTTEQSASPVEVRTAA
jgi:ABC-2 type transport system ATP-binding protein